MKRLCCIVLVCFFAAAPEYRLNAAEERTVTPALERVSLFKNGYIIVQQSIDIPASGLYRWDNVPLAVHGTFFTESDLDVEIRTTSQQSAITESKEKIPNSLEDFIGRRVSVLFGTPPKQYDGTLVSVAAPNHYTDNRAGIAPSMMAIPSLLIQKDGNRGHVFVPIKDIAEFSIADFEPGNTETTRTEKKPVMFFNAKAMPEMTAGKIQIMYLTQGATWAPSYRVKLLDSKTLSLEQNVVLLNEWMPIHNAEIALVSGFPQIETAGVVSPLHPDQSLRQFLAQLQSPSAGLARGDAGGMMSQSRSRFVSNEGSFDDKSVTPIAFDITATPGEGPDIHYNSIGKRTLEVGDSLALTTGKAEAAYERVLSCDLSDLVLNFWRQNAARGANIQIAEPEVFEVLKFANPLSFPMTTAPVTITDSQRFIGQSKTNWVSPRQPASVNITKVLNVSVTYLDEIDLSRRPDEMPEIPNRVPLISGFGDELSVHPLWSVGVFPWNSSNRFRLIPIRGTLEITNRRDESVTLHLTGAAVGVVELAKQSIAECDVPPKSQTVVPANREYAPNSVSRLYWELTLQPGEKKVLTLQSSRWVQGM